MTERKGSRMRWEAECGHWMVVYSLEPTPAECPDCADESRKELEDWAREVSTAETYASDCAIHDVAGWLDERGIALEPEHVAELQRIADMCDDAGANLNRADAELRKFLAEKLPAAERLTMPEAS